MAAACPAARAAAAAVALTSRAPRPATNRRRICPAVSSTPRAYARVRAIASRGLSASGASASNSGSTRSAQSAAQTATSRRSASLSVCGEATRGFFHATRGGPTLGARRSAKGGERAHRAARDAELLVDGRGPDGLGGRELAGGESDIRVIDARGLGVRRLRIELV